MSTTEAPTATVTTPIGGLTIRADDADAVRVDLAADVRINGVAYEGTAYACHVHPDQLQGRHEEGPPAWIVGSFRDGELRRWEGLYLRRAGSWDDPTPAATKKARETVEAAVSVWAATDEGKAALIAAQVRADEHARARARDKAEELRRVAALIERVGEAISRREPIAVDYREAHAVKDSGAVTVDYWYADGDRGGVTITRHGQRVPSSWTTPQGLTR